VFVYDYGCATGASLCLEIYQGTPKSCTVNFDSSPPPQFSQGVRQESYKAKRQDFLPRRKKLLQVPHDDQTNPEPECRTTILKQTKAAGVNARYFYENGGAYRNLEPPLAGEQWGSE
jgi:hypothetical protein